MTSSNREVISTLIHNARNPLNRISMQAELAKMLLSQDISKDKVVESLDKIIQGCQDCSEQLESISAFSKEL